MDTIGGALNLVQPLDKFSDHWVQRTIGTLNDYEIKLAKLLGEFVWHSHPDTDEMFLVLSGTLNIQLRDRNVIGGEVFVVPRASIVQRRMRGGRNVIGAEGRGQYWRQ